jgi:F0F1-type ATP synthase epsilon subunit
VNPTGLIVLAQTAVDLRELDEGKLAQEIENAEEDVADAADAAEDAVRDRAQTRLDHLRQVQTALNL